MGGQYGRNSLASSLSHFVGQALTHILYPRPRVPLLRLPGGLRRGVKQHSQFGAGVAGEDHTESPRSLALQQRAVGPLWFVAKSPRYMSLKAITVEHLEEVWASDVPPQPEVGTYGKWEFRRLHRIYQLILPESTEENRKKVKLMSKKARKEWWRLVQERKKATKSYGRVIYYWTRPGDDAIYLSLNNPPDEQQLSLARITLLKVDGDPSPQAAAQVAPDYSSSAELPRLVWKRYRQLAHKVDYNLHVAKEVARLVTFTVSMNERASATARLWGRERKKLRKMKQSKRGKLPGKLPGFTLPSWVKDAIKWFNRTNYNLRYILDHWNSGLKIPPADDSRPLDNPQAPGPAFFRPLASPRPPPQKSLDTGYDGQAPWS